MFFSSTYSSSNFNEREVSKPLDMIILHYTEMESGKEAISHLCNPNSKVSAHFIIMKTGEVHQLVDVKNRAWHAGVSYWQGETDINSRSIGIELDHIGHLFGYPPLFEKAQIEALLILLEGLVKAYHIPAYRILGHSDVAPSRKKDPGETFPWPLLEAHGLGIQKSKNEADKNLLDSDIATFQRYLKMIGYNCLETNELDESTIKILTAFQRHFVQDSVTDLLDVPTKKAILSVMQNRKGIQ